MAKKHNAKIDIPLCIEGWTIGKDILVCATEVIAAEVLIKRNDSKGITITQTGQAKHDKWLPFIQKGIDLAKLRFDVEIDDIDIIVKHKINHHSDMGQEVGILLGVLCCLCDMERSGHTPRDIYTTLTDHNDLSDREWHYGSAILLGGLRANYRKLLLSQKIYTPASLGITIITPSTPSVQEEHTSYPEALGAFILAATTGQIEDMIHVLKSTGSNPDKPYAELKHSNTSTRIMICPNTGIADSLVVEYQDQHTCYATTIKKEGLCAS